MSGWAYTILNNQIIKSHSKDFALHKFNKKENKGRVSMAIYILGIVMSFVFPWLGVVSYLAVLILWYIPNPKIEETLKNDE